MTLPDELKKAQKVMDDILEAGCCDKPEDQPCDNQQVKIIAQALRRQSVESRNEALEEAAILVESTDEIRNLKTGITSLQIKTSTNINGKGQAKGIRMLKSDLETKGE